MLKFKTIPMRYGGGGFVTLSLLAEILPANNLTWRILDFEAIGEVPGGARMAAFANAVRAAPKGYALSWKEFVPFASNMEQVWNCLIVATEPQITVDRTTLEDAGFPNCVYVSEVFGSNEWALGAESETILENFPETVEIKRTNSESAPAGHA